MKRCCRNSGRYVIAQDISAEQSNDSIYSPYANNMREVPGNMRNNIYGDNMNTRMRGNGDGSMGTMPNNAPIDRNFRGVMPNNIPVEDKRAFDIEVEYWKSMYPQDMKMLQQYIDEVCDKMDYNGSVMYDEFPDKVTLRRISNNIYEMLLNDGVISEEENDVNDDNVDNETEEENNEYEDDDDSDASFYKNMMNLESNQLRPPFGPGPERPPRPPYPPFGPGPGRPPRPPYPPFGPGPERPPRPPKPPVCNGNNCIADIVDVLLFNEMHRRRCRDNRCF